MPQLVQAAKKHLSQRIQHVDDKLEQLKEISVQIRDQVLWNSVSLLEREPRCFYVHSNSNNRFGNVCTTVKLVSMSYLQWPTLSKPYS